MENKLENEIELRIGYYANNVLLYMYILNRDFEATKIGLIHEIIFIGEGVSIHIHF